MGLAVSQATDVPDRLTRFRELRARLNPTGDPTLAFSQGFYVPSAHSVSQRLAAELALAPASTHLLIGGVGSGKTTELLATQAGLNDLRDTRAFYLDVSKLHDISKMMPGAVLAQAGLALAEGCLAQTEPRADRAAVESIASHHERNALERHFLALRKVALGYWDESQDVGPGEQEGLVRVNGLLAPPVRFEGGAAEVLRLIGRIFEYLFKRWAHVVVLLDGLDRMTDMASFQQLVEHDVAALSSRGVGVVLVGPLRAQYGLDRAVIQNFDQLHYQAWVDPGAARGVASFLASVLRQRVPAETFGGAALDVLVKYSGGVLRDLLSLTQSACVESYLSGADAIGLKEVETAADAFGRKHMQGLRPGEIEVLKRVLTQGTFVQTSEDDLALLMTRRVLEYRQEAIPRYKVHPTLVPFLGAVGQSWGQ